MSGRDWQVWHQAYDQPGSTLAQRLMVVRERVERALDGAPPGPLKVISMCAGEGRDLIPVLASHSRGRDATARLVELDPLLAETARRSAASAGLDGVEVVVGDAGVAGVYAGLAPADLVLVCGVFGNITDPDIERTVGCCAALCKTGGVVIWTRARTAPDKVPQICEWFADREFELLWLSEPGLPFGVGAHRFAGRPQVVSPGARMFAFVGFDHQLGPGAADGPPGAPAASQPSPGQQA